MSKRADKILSLTGIDPSKISNNQLHEVFSAYLENGMHGIGFSAYEEGQKPGDELTLEQVQRRMTILKPSIKWVRSFSCLQGNELRVGVLFDQHWWIMIGYTRVWAGSCDGSTRIRS